MAGHSIFYLFVLGVGVSFEFPKRFISCLVLDWVFYAWQYHGFNQYPASCVYLLANNNHDIIVSLPSQMRQAKKSSQS